LCPLLTLAASSKRSMKRGLILQGIAALLLMLWAGCASSRSPQLTCAVVGLRGKTHVFLSPVELAHANSQLSRYLAARGLVLIPNLDLADRLATVTYEPDPANPGVGVLQVHSIGPNMYNRNNAVTRRGNDLNIDASNPGAVNREEVGFSRAASQNDTSSSR
jgi:hypothetical protein